MNDVTRILEAIETGDSGAADELLPLVYAELRRLAQQKLSQEPPGQTLQATALVHEAYLRLVSSEEQQEWDSRGHFFSAAAEAMRRILVDRARQKKSCRHGGNLRRIQVDEQLLPDDELSGELLALDQALAELHQHDEQAARLVTLRYFGGLTHQQAAEILGVSRRAADRLWSLARAWLHERISKK